MWRKFCWPFLSTRLRPLVEKVLLTLPEHSISAQDVSRICVAQSVVICVVLCMSFLLIPLLFYFWYFVISALRFTATGIFKLVLICSIMPPCFHRFVFLSLVLEYISWFLVGFNWFHETIASIVDVTVSITRTHQQQLTCQRSSHHCNKHKISDETFSPDSVLLRYILTTLYNTTSKIVPDDSYLTKLLYSTHAVNTVMK
jgi:hypothetical protein